MTWGLTLSGGAACGLANIGVLEVLEEQNLKPDCIAGSSMGAIVGGLYAFGISINDIKNMALEMKPWNIASLSNTPMHHGLHGGFLRQRIEETLSPLLGSARIADCSVPFVCIAGKVKEPVAWEKIIQSGFTEHAMQCIEPHVFNPETKLIDALTATSAIPVLFSPAQIGGDSYIDLCHFGAIPARTMKDTFNPGVLIATDTNPRMPSLEKWLPKAWQQFIEDGIAELEKSKAVCDVVIEPPMVASPFAFHKAKEFIEAGRQACNEQLILNTNFNQRILH